MVNKKVEEGFGICGLDEAGRGALAGPLFLAAVVMPLDFRFEEVAPNVLFDKITAPISLYHA